MKIFKLVLINFLLFGTVMAQPYPKPQGETLEEYAESLKDYNEGQFRPALPGQEEAARQVIEHVRTFDGDPSQVNPKDLFKYDRGATKAEVSDNWKADIFELAGNYKWQDTSGCADTRMVGVCAKWSPAVDPEGDPEAGEAGGGSLDFIPMWAYYVPFQRVESHNVPFTTGYWPTDDADIDEPLFLGILDFVTYGQLDPTIPAKRALDGKDPTLRTMPGVRTMLIESEAALYDGFMPLALQPIIEGILSASGDDGKMEWKERLPKNWEFVVTEYLKNLVDNEGEEIPADGSIGGDRKVDREIIDKFKETFDMQVSRWRARQDMTGGAQTAEYHFSSTLFHEVTKDFPWFNTVDMEQPFVPLTWCHFGANHGCLGKPIEPVFFSEWVYHGLFARTYSMLSFLWNGISNYTPPIGEPLNCAEKNRAPEGDTPVDMRLSKYNTGPDNPVWCMSPNHNDAIGPITNYHKTNYPTVASDQAFRRGLLAAQFLPVFNALVHPARDRQEGDLLRDKQMIFSGKYDQDLLVEYVKTILGTEPTSDHNPNFPKGCQSLDEQEELTNDWGGAAYGPANHLNPKYSGHRHARAHLRYIACCPCDYIKIFGPTDQWF